jgi:hypothetical protein
MSVGPPLDLNRTWIAIDRSHKELGWFRKGMDEWAVRTFLIKNLNVIEKSLTLEHFIGFNIFFQGKQEADMLFGKNGTYYVIETE